MNILMNRVFIFLFFIPCLSFAQVTGSSQVVEKTVISYNDTVKLNFLHDPSIYTEGWDTLNQTRFWREVINLTSDTCIINIASCRQPLSKVCRGEWMQLTEDEKKFIKDSLTCVNQLDGSSTLFVTSGKEEFYELKKVLPEISKAINVVVSVAAMKKNTKSRTCSGRLVPSETATEMVPGPVVIGMVSG